MIAALFVETGGVYFGIDGVDPWDIKRNAMQYRGPHPVVAHPPCQLWGKLARVNYKRWGGEHNKPGNDKGMFKFALDCVNTYGGVLEHPAGTYAWGEYDLARPEDFRWSPSGDGWVCKVQQSSYGHKARKTTWLYYCGVLKPFELNWDKTDAEFQIGFQDQRGKQHNKPTLTKKEANATPIAFRDELIKLAQYSIKD